MNQDDQDDDYISDNFDQDGGYQNEGQSAVNEAAVAIANQKHELVDKEVEQVIKKNEDTRPKSGYMLPMDDDDIENGNDQMEDEDPMDGDAEDEEGEMNDD